MPGALTYEQFYDILHEALGTDNVVYGQASNISYSGEPFIFFYTTSNRFDYADNDIHMQHANVIIQIYVKSDEQYKVKDTVAKLMHTFKVPFDVTHQVPQVQDYTCYVMHVKVVTDLIDWM